MSNIPSNPIRPQIEQAQFRAPVSESLIQGYGSTISDLMDKSAAVQAQLNSTIGTLAANQVVSVKAIYNTTTTTTWSLQMGANEYFLGSFFVGYYDFNQEAFGAHHQLPDGSDSTFLMRIAPTGFGANYGQITMPAVIVPGHLIVAYLGVNTTLKVFGVHYQLINIRSS